ncbi:CxC2 domain-containing protein [Mycena kentingensis (nom. inval.)]|nr:CxC2 domain-containing protein [Mycena kentingensis (nom. inval.)]
MEPLMQLCTSWAASSNTAGAAATSPGELAIRCPACPRPGVNLPDDWQLAPPEDQCLYIVYIAMDACFRLKRRLIGSDLRDPGLGTGFAYLVEWEPYRQYLKTITDQKEMSTCSGLAALDHANTKFSRGYSATGVGAGICARHEFVQPNGVADLQRGERYGNMDYILGSLLRHIHTFLRKVFSYNVSCQWSKELRERLLRLPPLVRLSLVLALCRFVVPKMHIKGHIVLCQLMFSLALVPGSGNTDGEGIERLWAAIAGLAASTKLSGHGARADALDVHWSFWNWMRLVGLPKLLRRRGENARVQRAVQEEAFQEFSERQAANVPVWLKAIEDFEADGRNPNPYESANKDSQTEAQVRKEMEEEELAETQRGNIPVHAVGPSEFVSFALEIEEQQRRLRVRKGLKGNASNSGIRLKPLRRKLTKDIRRYRDMQLTYMPAALLHLQTLKLPADIPVEDLPLLLPSALPTAMRDSEVGKHKLADLERRLRHAQCKDALMRLRNRLHLCARLLIYKRNHSRHQGANTRSRALLDRNEEKIKGFADTYQANWGALQTLEGSDLSWPQLHARDIRGLEDDDDLSKTESRRRRELDRRLKRTVELMEDGVLDAEHVDLASLEAEGSEEEEDVFGSKKDVRSGEGKRQVSWIWTVAGTTGTDASLQDALRVEWSKSCARTRRWSEECRILEEEWRRYPISLAHEEARWLARANAASSGALAASSSDTVEGKTAYAHKQAAVFRDLIARAEEIRVEVWKGRGHRRGRGQRDETHPHGAPESNDEMSMDQDAPVQRNSGEQEGDDSPPGLGDWDDGGDSDPDVGSESSSDEDSDDESGSEDGDDEGGDDEDM